MPVGEVGAVGVYCFGVGAYYCRVGAIVLTVQLLFSMMWVLLC